MSSNSVNLPSPPVFSGKDYHIWNDKMQNYLIAFDLWEAVEEGYEPPAEDEHFTVNQLKADKEKRLKNYRALTVIQSAISNEIHTRILGLKNAKSVWDTLQAEFHGTKRVRAVNLLTARRDFEALRMKDDEPIKAYVDKLNEIVSQMRMLGSDITESSIVNKVLVSLPSKFDSKVDAIEESKDLSKLTMNELIGSLQANEKRHSNRTDATIEGAFFANQKKPWKRDNQGSSSKPSNPASKKKEHTCTICKRKGHFEKTYWNKGKPQCSYCKRFGHVEKECRKRKYETENHKSQQANHAEDEENAFMVTQAKRPRQRHEWLIDSGCTSHMTFNKDLFLSLDMSSKTNVIVGNGETLKAEGRGTVSVKTSNGARTIKDVLYVPNLDQNLLSVGQIMKSGCCLTFQEEYCRILDSNMKLIAQAKINNNSFSLNWENGDHKAMMSKADESWLWHKRYGHCDLRKLSILSSKGLVEDIPKLQVQTEICECCQLGKMKRKPFPINQANRASEKLQLVHSDVCGPMKVPSLNNNKFFLLFIDDQTRYGWIYFLNNKSEVFGLFKKFKALVEAQSKKKIKVLRTDNGGEYNSTEFKYFCETQGIVHQFTVPYSPQQNGVAERRNRTIMEMSRSILFEKKIPKRFWAEAAFTSMHLLNRLPTKAVEGKTPYEAWFNLKPSASHLKVFGSICFIHVPDAKRDKLSEKSEKCVLVGYSAESKGYRVFNPKSNKVMVSRDVTFDELASLKWDNEDEESSELLMEEQAVQSEPLSDEEDEPENPRFRSIDDVYQRCNLAISEPSCYEEAKGDPNWEQAMNEEISTINKNET